ncbi:MAG: hypothetical protein KKD39_00170 [Candidatus Altiarchaeota archaeon]|nr:hypothetical protein [Candidatus Altiarchaeota archaeon]
MAFNELQGLVRDLDLRFGWVSDSPDQTVLHMQEELGEISREMLKRSKYKKEVFEPSKLNDEIADLIYLTLKLANLLDLDVDDAWERITKRYCVK